MAKIINHFRYTVKKNNQLEQEFSAFVNKLDSLIKHDIEIKQRINLKKDQKQHYH